jgi:hypothetical protein
VLNVPQMTALFARMTASVRAEMARFAGSTPGGGGSAGRTTLVTFERGAITIPVAGGISDDYDVERLGDALQRSLQIRLSTQGVTA